MRYLFAIVSLALACCSITMSRVHFAPASWLCQEGFCGIDSITSETSSKTATPVSFVAAANQAPSDPYVWSAYAESLAASGDAGRARTAFEHAVSLGPDLPSILLSAAYFDFTHGQFERGEALSNRILSKTADFDPLVFSYLHYFGHGALSVLGTGVPAQSRPAQAWAEWIAENGSETEVMDTSAWMMRSRLMDTTTALDLTWKLWGRQLFRSADELWSNWHAISDSDSGARELLVNPRFEKEPDGSPFDWGVPKQKGVEITREQGLKIRFLGTDNVGLGGIRQSTMVRPGRYRFSAVVESEGLSTDQGPFFHVFDPKSSGQVDVQTPQVHGSTGRSETGCDVVVPRGTEALTIELDRQASSRFDNKIQGTLHVYEVSLVPAN